MWSIGEENDCVMHRCPDDFIFLFSQVGIVIFEQCYGTERFSWLDVGCSLPWPPVYFALRIHGKQQRKGALHTLLPSPVAGTPWFEQSVFTDLCVSSISWCCVFFRCRQILPYYRAEVFYVIKNEGVFSCFYFVSKYSWLCWGVLVFFAFCSKWSFIYPHYLPCTAASSFRVHCADLSCIFSLVP